MTDNATLYINVNVLDGSGQDSFPGEVLVSGNRIAKVADSSKGESIVQGSATLVDGGGRSTLMPGLCDAHTHITWNDGPTLEASAEMPVEEHLLLSLENAKLYLDCGYTSCVGAASAKLRMDVVLRNAINSGKFPGPRLLAAGPEVATTGADVIETMPG